MDDFTIDVKYTRPMRTYSHWWLVELDPDQLSGFESTEYLMKTSQQWFSAPEASVVDAISFFADSVLSNHDIHVFDRILDMQSFKNLKYVSIPLDASFCLDIKSISENLLHLRIDRPRSAEYSDFYKRKIFLPIFDVLLPNLRTLDLLASPIVFENFNIDLYPSLEWITTDLEFDSCAKFARFLSGKANLKGLSLSTIKNKSLLLNLPKSLEGLELWSIRSKSFDYSTLEQFASLRFLSLRNSLAPIDCTVISKLINLEELVLFDFPSFASLEKLMALDKLQKIHIYSNTPGQVRSEFIRNMKEKFCNASVLNFEIF